MTGPAVPLALVVSAYPPTGAGTSLLSAVRDGLAGRYDVAVVDLDGYRPAMTREEWEAYEDGPVDPTVAAHADLVVRARVLVFVYPSVWMSLPAPLKGWLDRTLLPGVAFTLGPDRRVRPALAELRAVVGVTTYRQDRRTVRRSGDGGRRTLLRALRLNAPRPVRTRWLGLPSADRSADIAGFAARVRRTVEAL